MKKYHTTYYYAGLLAVVSLLWAGPAFGDVAFTTLSTAGTYDANAAASVEYVEIPQKVPLTEAASFVPTISGDLSSIEVGITAGGGTFDGNFTLSLMANNPSGGPDPTNVLATSPILTATVVFALTANSSLETFTYTGPAVALSAGTTYWLAASPGDTNSLVQWNFASTTSPSSELYQSINNGPYTAVSLPNGLGAQAFEVDVIPGSPVPEPTTALFGMALMGVCALARRRK